MFEWDDAETEKPLAQPLSGLQGNSPPPQENRSRLESRQAGDRQAI
ncbi:MAG: hypothetical protein MUC60_16215 [Oscillatoria sp. Prado101]|nr:hypothetical protein [Oscillatoria sp. Prado101]